METYKLLFSIIKMPTVFTFCALLLTAKVIGIYTINIWLTLTCSASRSLVENKEMCVPSQGIK